MCGLHLEKKLESSKPREEMLGTFYGCRKSTMKYSEIKFIKTGNNESFVKWKGLPDSFNSWVFNKGFIAQ